VSIYCGLFYCCYPLFTEQQSSTTQYPDIQADAKVGRNHFPIAYGVSRSNLIYGLFTLLTIPITLLYIFYWLFTKSELDCASPMPLAFFSLYGAIKHKEAIGSFPHYLGAKVSSMNFRKVIAS